MDLISLRSDAMLLDLIQRVRQMSSSNATHVHMLNASLDTEATYACEISTQDLSTIRYQKEIRVYG